MIVAHVDMQPRCHGPWAGPDHLQIIGTTGSTTGRVLVPGARPGMHHMVVVATRHDARLGSLAWH